MTDPLNHHTTSFAYDSQGRLQSSTNALASDRLHTNTAGRVVSIRDPLSKVTDVRATPTATCSVWTTPLGNDIDAVQRRRRALVSVIDATGSQTNVGVQRPRPSHKDHGSAQGGDTTFTYDGNGNLLTLDRRVETR